MSYDFHMEQKLLRCAGWLMGDVTLKSGEATPDEPKLLEDAAHTIARLKRYVLELSDIIGKAEPVWHETEPAHALYWKLQSCDVHRALQLDEEIGQF